MNQNVKLFIEKNSSCMHRVGVQLDNSEKWLEVDKALTREGKVIIPVPHFFTASQIQHMLTVTSMDTVICEFDASLFWQSKGFEIIDCMNGCVLLNRSVKTQTSLPDKTHKITFTSGTTAEPKGVCLSRNHIVTVAKSLAAVVKEFAVKRHMSVLPMSVLLENIASNYSASELGIEVVSPLLKELGFTGSSQLDIQTLVKALNKYRPHSVILMPQILKSLLLYIQQEAQDLSFLKFIAVGGAVCPRSLIEKGHEMGLPVFEGYGISECASVISLSTNIEDTGTVGKVLPHQEVTLAEDGEILVHGPVHLGYVGETEKPASCFATGDLGEFSGDGKLVIKGRKKNVIINSYGRNISPEWIEAELTSIPGVLQAVVYGEGQPFLTAICASTLSSEEVQAAVQQINPSLPDYAQIKSVILSDSYFTYENHMATSSGKLKYQQIFNHFNQQLQRSYATN